MVRPRFGLLALIAVWVLVPFLLYSDWLSHSTDFRREHDLGIVNVLFLPGSQEFDEETSNLLPKTNDARKLSAHKDEPVARVKEPIQITADAASDFPIKYSGSKERDSDSHGNFSTNMNINVTDHDTGGLELLNHRRLTNDVVVIQEVINGQNRTHIGEKEPWMQNTKELHGKERTEHMPNDTRAEVHRLVKTVSSSNNGGVRNTSDATVRTLQDQLKRADVFLSLGPTRAHRSFFRDLRLRIRDIQQVLGDATMDFQLPKNVQDKMRAMELTLAKGKKIQDDCALDIKRLTAALHSMEEKLNASTKERNYLSQVTAQSLPRGLTCLTLQLTNEYYTTYSSRNQYPHEGKFEDPALYHYTIISDNVLATAVVVNSTVSNAKKPEKHVFHVVTDKLNYAAMRMWFLVNPPGKAAVQVQNIENFSWLNSSYSPVLKQLESDSMIEYYFKSHKDKRDANLKYRNPKYLSILNHLRFYLPQIFPKLPKVLFLDDDVVVQRDLTPVWSIDLKGKVNGAVETCGKTFHRFDKYLNFSNPLIAKNFNPHACGWAYGMNIFDLDEWRKENVTEVYHHWQRLNEERLLWKLGTLPVGLATFWNRTLPIDRSWHRLGLGYNPDINRKDIERGAVIHYNGNLKPWLEIGLPQYRNYWAKYLNFDNPYLRACNIHR